jgi:hypothetical protein
MSKSKIETTLICFFEIRGTIDFVTEGTTVNQAFYMEVLKRFTDTVRRKRKEMWRDRPLIHHHNNMPAHSSLRVSQIYQENSSLPRINRRTLRTWLKLTSTCFQN